MRQLRSAVLAFALGVIALAQSGSPLTNPEVRRIGDMLLCLCGCGSTVTTCDMQHCHFSEPAREKLLTMVNAGMGEKQILDAFVKEYGVRILVKPPAEGFNLVGWIMPFVAIAAGLAIVWLLIQRFRKPLASREPAVEAAALAQYQERIDRDLEKLDE